MAPGTARYERDGGVWQVSAHALGHRVELRARSLERARVDVVQAVAERSGTYRGAVALVDDVDLPARASRALARARKARDQAINAALRSQEATAHAAQQLTEAGLSLRDSAYLLGLSHSRIQQLLGQ